jgi:lambda family phage portal protein
MRAIFDPKTKQMIRSRRVTGRRRSNRSSTYDIVNNDQFLQNWLTSQSGPNAKIQGHLSRLIEMARSLEENPYGANFFNQWTANVIGVRGFTLESCPLDRSGSVDDADKKVIEDAWTEWKRAANCTPGGNLPWAQVKRLNEKSFVRDGGVLLRLLPGYGGNPFGFAVQAVEVDQMDFDLNVSQTRDNRQDVRIERGNRIVMGKEVTPAGRCVAFHLFGEHPGEPYVLSGRKRTRVPADNMIHRFHQTRHGQYQGVPVPLAAMTSLRHHERYSEAEVIAARMHACSVMALEDINGMDGVPSADFEETDHFDFELEPGAMADVPAGKKLSLMKPEHPNGNFAAFQKAILRGAAAGLGLNYNLLASDLEGVNYSSLREGKLSQNAIFDVCQSINIEMEEEPVFRAWLQSVLVQDRIGLPYAQMAKYQRVKWHTEKRPWVDPQKDASAAKMLLELGLTSPRRIAATLHSDSLEAVAEETAADLAMMAQKGLGAPEWAQPIVTDEVAEIGSNEE